MNRTFLLLAATVSVVALSACKTSDSGGSSLTYNITPVQDLQEDVATPVESTGAIGPNAADHENINDNRFEVTFTADQKLIIEDVIGGNTYEFDEDDLVNSFSLHEVLHMYASTLNNAHELVEPDWNDPVEVDAYLAQLQSVTIYTPERDRNAPEYALARITADGNDNWVWMGTPTSTVLSGNATYEGGYYLVDSSGPDTANGRLEIAADFGANGQNGTMDFTLFKPDSLDPAFNDAVFGVDSISFTSGVSNGNVRTVDGGGNFAPAAINEAGAHYTHATVAGGLFENGNTTAGLIHLEHTNGSGRYGGYHAQVTP